MAFPPDNYAPTKAWEAGRQKPNNLDFLRLFLATWVMLSHAYQLAWGNEVGYRHEPTWLLSQGQVSGGELAVNGFFILSGFLITQSALSSKGLWDFAIKRLRRIYPGFLVAGALCVLLVGPVATGQSPLLPPIEMLKNAVRLLVLREPLFPNAFATNPYPITINGSLWTIKYEMVCYVLTALLMITGLLRRPLVPLVLCLVGFVALCLWRLNLIILPFGKPTEWAIYYLIGAVFFLWRERIPYSRVLFGGSLLMLVVGCLLPPLLPFLLPVFGTYALLFAGFTPVKGLASAAKYGDISYGVYLYAFPVQQLLMHFVPTLTPLTQLALAVPMTFALAFLSWHGVEKHFLTRARHALPTKEVTLR